MFWNTDIFLGILAEYFSLFDYHILTIDTKVCVVALPSTGPLTLLELLLLP